MLWALGGFVMDISTSLGLLAGAGVLATLIMVDVGNCFECSPEMLWALGGFVMDISTSLGLLAGAGVLATLIMLGGDLRMFADMHAAIVIFGGSFAATLIRFPLASIFHGLPLGAKFAFTLRRMSQRDLVNEIAGLAEVARKQGPIGLEKVEIEDPFLAKGVRFVADGYDGNFIRDNLERDRDNFLTHLDEGQKIYRAVGDCAPAFWMIGTLIGMVQMFANRRAACNVLRSGGEPPVPADRRQVAPQARR